MNFKKCPYFKVFFLALICCFAYKAKAQDNVKNIISKIDNYNTQMPAEKLYLQFDKPYYAVGDTIWFKSYLLNPSLSYSPLSSRIYVELLNDSAKVVKRFAFPMSLGISWGNIALDDIRAGSYNIRAYTTWMRNFNPETFFTRAFYIANPQKQTWLVNASSNLTGGNTPTGVKMAVKFTSIDNQSAGLKPMNLRVVEGKKVLFKGELQTNAEGLLNLNFPLPEKAPVKSLVLIAQDKADPKKTVSIPLNANRAKDIDVQFMPESGYMIAGLPSHIGFKAIGDDGMGIDVTGKIINKTSGAEVLTFNSAHKGLGVLDLAPQAGDVYVAQVTLPDGQMKEMALPAVKPSGTALRIRNIPSRDSLEVMVFMTNDLIKSSNNYYLLGQSRNVVCFGAAIPATKNFASVHVAKSLFPTGIAHFTLLNGQNQPVNERLSFINHHDNLKMTITPGQKTYAPHDSIPVKITVNDIAGKPVVGSFSVAVTDDSQVNTDNVGRGNILTRFLLTADLKGFVEDPEYYFKNETNETWQALDALLLTQGWIGYDWNAINTMQKPLYKPEIQYAVSGKVTNLLGKPIAKANVTLLSTGKYRTVSDTVTDANGRFSIHKLPPIDSVTFVLSAQNSRHKTIKAGISVDDVQPPLVDPQYLQKAMPWYVNSDESMINYVKTNPTYHKELDKTFYGPMGRLLNTVNIRNRSMVKGSYNLNGSGEADQVLDEQTIEDANKITLEELLLQKIKGFRVGYLPNRRRVNRRGGSMSGNTTLAASGGNMMYFVKDKKVRFVFDGIDLSRFFSPTETSENFGGGSSTSPSNELYEYYRQYLQYFTAEDIKGVEVLYTTRYINRYNVRNMDADEIMDEDETGPSGSATAYVEITTRAGAGPFSNTSSGVYVYKPMQITIPKDFYRPRYVANDTNTHYGDLRSTIHWQPSVVTNKSGEATVSFFAADKPATYTIILEGSNLDGKIGYQTQKVTVK